MSLLSNRRVLVLAHALRGRTSGGSLQGFLRNVLSPTCTTVAARHLSAVEDRGDVRAVRLAGDPRTLFFPAAGDLHMLHQVVTEQLEPWMWHYYEVPETRVGPGDVVLDCGAAEGLFTFLVQPRARQVYCFEPLPDFRACLERTFEGVSNVTVVPVALADRSGWAYLRQAGISTMLTDEPTGERVEVTTVDEFCAREGVRPTYLKADLEGHELKLLQGARETIRAGKPRIAITTYHQRGDADELESYLRSLRPDYRFRRKGIEHHWGEPVMLHAW